MRLSIKAFLAVASVAAVSTVLVESAASPFIAGTARWSSLAATTATTTRKVGGGAFGLATSVASLTRGGAEEEPQVAPEAEVLYLPGLLEASIVKTAKVSEWLGCAVLLALTTVWHMQGKCVCFLTQNVSRLSPK